MNTVGEDQPPLTESAVGAALLEWVSVFISRNAIIMSKHMLLLIVCSLDQRAATFPKSFDDQ